MESDRFKELALGYVSWVKSACRNKQVGDDIYPNIEHAFIVFNSNRDGQLLNLNNFQIRFNIGERWQVPEFYFMDLPLKMLVRHD